MRFVCFLNLEESLLSLSNKQLIDATLVDANNELK